MLEVSNVAAPGAPKLEFELEYEEEEEEVDNRAVVNFFPGSATANQASRRRLLQEEDIKRAYLLYGYEAVGFHGVQTASRLLSAPHWIT